MLWGGDLTPIILISTKIFKGESPTFQVSILEVASLELDAYFRTTARQLPNFLSSFFPFFLP